MKWNITLREIFGPLQILNGLVVLSIVNDIDTGTEK